MFPSLIVSADAIRAHGSFAETQATYLRPDPTAVARLENALRRANAGVVAHYYMDPELQGVLSAVDWPHVHISDSLLMADRGVQMVERGASAIVVLGVDFMSENVRAMLDAAGHSTIPVYRVAAEPIGCSLAESAEEKTYGAYLTRASRTPRSLHVVYINTSLRTKAKAHALVPTITCTSSNVVRTVLSAFAEIEDLHVWFGPDTYMGRNLSALFASLATMTDEAIAAVHARHDRASIASLLPRFHFFEQGTCIVHHMFGEDVVRRVRSNYPDAFITAHLEVPGEMFELGMEAKREDRGVVGSTSDILAFITRKVKAASGRKERLQFVLGTEAGMITSIVHSLKDALTPGIEVEIVFPVASEAITKSSDVELPVVPGVSGGEGCSTAGGCATCPFMKMNSLDALFDVLDRISEPKSLLAFHPRVYNELVRGRSTAELGREPILHMREFQRSGQLPRALVEDVLSRSHLRSA